MEKPEPKTYIEYSDTDSFDLLLSASLRNDPLRTVTVNTENPIVLSENLPDRLNRWLFKMQKSGNSIYKCPAKDAQTRGLFLAALEIISDVAYSKWREYETYKPASSYNALAYIDSPTGKKIDDKIVEIKFVPVSAGLDVEGCKKH